MTDELPKIDYDRIDFPSGRLTLQQIRFLARAYTPHGDLEHYLDDHAEGLAVMYSIETMFADLGFAKGSGNSQLVHLAISEFTCTYENPDADQAVQAATRELSRYYKQFGIADGVETTRQAARRLEDSAADHARHMLGRTGGGGS